MGVFDLLQGIFSLETLDTRLVPPPERALKVSAASERSRWASPEFLFYLVVFLITVPLMFHAGMSASNETNPNYVKFENLLSEGWMWGRKVDNSDTQYSFFRNNFWLLCGLIAGHTLLRRAFSPMVAKRSHFDAVVAVVFLFAVHGVNLLKYALLVAFNYAIPRILPQKMAAVVTWTFGVLSLFIVDRIHPLSTGVGLIDSGFKGLVERWDVFFNFTVLRMVSFNMDYIERAAKLGSPELLESPSLLSLSQLSDRERLTAPLPINDYSVVNYMAYLGYAPLYLVGPIVTFNDYVYQSNYQQAALVKDGKRTLMYLVRLLFCVLCMEFILHHMYVVAVSKTKAWAGDTPFQISMLGLFNLNVIWLKLLIPWRFFRLWALLDGIDAPENMIRCMNNNFLPLAFWRAWHRSFNRWVIRYIYVPLGGGGKNRIANSLLVFSFVAVWHDIELRMLMWGWLIVLFLLPEIGASLYFKRFSGLWWYRHVCALGSVANIWMMMLANLFGFCLGQEGTVALLNEMFSTWRGLEFFLLSLGALFVGAQVMFELREGERRRGMDVRC